MVQIAVQAVAAAAAAVLFFQVAGLRSWALVLAVGGVTLLAGLPFIWLGARKRERSRDGRQPG